LVRPVTVQLVVNDVQVRPPGAEVTVYPVITAPPVLDGTDQETSTDPSPDDALTPEGAPGTVDGTISVEDSDASPIPAAVFARMTKVYAMPLVRPATTQLVVEVVQVKDPGEEITVYPVMGRPPVDEGADHETVTWESPNTPATSVGASATVAGTTEPDALEAAPEPALFVAVTVNV
jgi:hypothetical protein